VGAVTVIGAFIAVAERKLLLVEGVESSQTLLPIDHLGYFGSILAGREVERWDREPVQYGLDEEAFLDFIPLVCISLVVRDEQLVILKPR
jgi:hypothetical protein